MKHRPDLLSAESPKGIEIIQLTTETDVPSSHVYMEAQIFTLDSKRFVLHRSATAHGGDQHDPKHQYLLCDLEDNCKLTPLTHEVGVTAPSVSPDGKYLYYFINETVVGGGKLTLKRVGLDGSDRRTIIVIDSPLPGTDGFRPSHIYSLSTISSDGKRLALPAHMGDGSVADAPFGLMVFDLEKATVQVILSGQSWCNIHPQYSRSLDPEQSHDILVQENHGNTHDAAGNIVVLVSGDGADIHVIRDDGTNFRDMPWGRDGNEFCQGHQCWRGRSNWAVTSTGTRQPHEQQLIESQPVPHVGHIGLKHPAGHRNDLSRTFPGPNFFHFGTDIEGKYLITDAGPQDGGGRLFFAKFGVPGQDPLMDWTFLINPRNSWKKESHIHPFLSPNGKLGFFNSDESGILQAYMVRGLENL